MGFESFEVTGNDTIREVVYDFLIVFNSNYGSILHCFWDIFDF